MKILNKLPAVEWAPLHIPLDRRFQFLACALWISIMLAGELACLGLYVMLLYKGNVIVRTLWLIYTIFMYFDWDVVQRGGRGVGSNWVRNWIWWDYFQKYFPAAIHKTVDLPADRNYLLAAFPHGIISSTTFINFCTNATRIHSIFPGLRPKAMTLDFHFKIPIFRELLLSWGMGSVSTTGLVKVLSQSNDKNDPTNDDGFTGNMAVVMIGGAQEALNSKPDRYQIVIKKRKGFVRVAFRTGASLVPVINFGEVNIYKTPANPPGSMLRTYQQWFKRLTGIAPAKFMGRGFFQYTVGLFPRRCPLNTVVGAPIDLPKNANPTMEEVDQVHQKFCDALNELFESHKAMYIKDHENVHLIME